MTNSNHIVPSRPPTPAPIDEDSSSPEAVAEYWRAVNLLQQWEEDRIPSAIAPVLYRTTPRKPKKEWTLVTRRRKPPHTVNRKVPAPRLVGIELNPGPKSPLVVAGVAGALGREILGVVKGAVKEKIKNTAQGAVRQKKRKKKNKNQGVPRGLSTNSRMSSVRAPVSIGHVYQSNIKSPTIELAFDCLSMTIYSNTTASSTSGLCDFSSDATSFANTLAVTPVYVPAENAFAPFGPQVQIVAKAFTQWRLKSLRIEFVSPYGTNTSGLLAISGSADIQNGPSTFSGVLSQYPQMTLPAWGADLACMDLKTACAEKYGGQAQLEWYSTDPTSNIGTSGARTWSPFGIGAYYSGYAAQAAHTPLGFLRFQGVVEFCSPAVSANYTVEKPAPSGAGCSSDPEFPPIEPPDAQVCTHCNPKRSPLLPRGLSLAKAVEGSDINDCHCDADYHHLSASCVLDDSKSAESGVTDSTRVAMLEQQLAMIRSKLDLI